MPYRALVAVSAAVAATSKRTEKVAHLAAFLRSLAPTDRAAAVGMLVGEPRQGRLGVGWVTAHGARPSAPAAAPGAGPAVAGPAVAGPAAASPSIADVDRTLGMLATTSGPGSQRRREELLGGLMATMAEEEQHHLVRLLTGEMRQGANEGVVADAIARAAGVPAADLRRAAMLLGDLGRAAERALAGQSLAVGLTPLVAVQPMLAATSASAAEAVAATGPASVEWKLDGMRVQAHRSGDDIRVYSRGMNDVTASLPNVVRAVAELPVTSVVLDGEALGLGEDSRPRRFQETMSGLGSTDAFFFDVLHLDGDSLIDESLAQRKQLLRRVLPERVVLPAIETDDGDEADAFAASAVAAGQEGVVVKALASTYQAGRRGTTWRKVKPVHTLDLVVLAAEWGHGRRTGWLSNLHLGARAAADSSGELVMVGKTFKGMTDELLRWQTAELQARAIATDGFTVHVRPELVVEIALDGVQVSRRYPGGVALRFARVRRYRPDRRPEDADTIDRVRSMLG